MPPIRIFMTIAEQMLKISFGNYLYIYIYIYIYVYYIVVKKIIDFLRRFMICSTKVNYLFRKYDLFVREYGFCQESLLIRIGNMNCSFENMNVYKKNNYLLRKYDLLIQEDAKVTPK